MNRQWNRIKSLLLTLTLALPVLLIGCGDDKNPTSQDNGDGDTTTVEIGRGTIDSLLSVYFPEYYTNRNLDACAAMLDDRYMFQRLPNDPGEPVDNLVWDRDEELAIAKVMFDGTANANGQSVESITLNINVGSIVPSVHPDEPADEEWFDVLAIVDMTVVLNDPNQSDGTGILNVLIDSEQKFVVTEDADSPGDWVCVRQEDRNRINRGVPGDGATEDAAWSDIKSLFRVAASKRGTISELLTEYFPEVYERKLHADYASMLEPRYTFQKLPDDPDQPIDDLFWNKSEELRITRRMFNGKASDAGHRVRWIALNIQNEAVTPSFDTDQQPGDEWFDVLSTIDLVVQVNDPSQSDGTGLLNLLIDASQRFIVAADPDSPDEWVIVKQEDQGRINKGGISATEETSWGAVKDLFR